MQWSPIRALGALILFAMTLGACSIVAGLQIPSVSTTVALAGVTHRVNGSERPAGTIERAESKVGTRSTYSDADIGADLTVRREFVEMNLHNKTKRTFEVDWAQSQFTNIENVGAPLMKAGEVTLISGDKSPGQDAIAPGAVVHMRLARHTGDTAKLGGTSPLFNVDNGDMQRAERSARSLLGKHVRIILELKQGSDKHQYTFDLRLDEVRLNGKPVSP